LHESNVDQRSASAPGNTMEHGGENRATGTCTASG